MDSFSRGFYGTIIMDKPTTVSIDNKVGCFYWAKVSLIQPDELKYECVLLMSDGRMEQEMGRQIMALSTLITALILSVRVKKESS